ncbi:MAG: hypothetical protein LUD12_15765 [Lachnospiraceae bacterium]|nr:hypothetical protein [Lachnospiraceae bacterium]
MKTLGIDIGTTSISGTIIDGYQIAGLFSIFFNQFVFDIAVPYIYAVFMLQVWGDFQLGMSA